jgi:hypothetical protein
LCCLFFIWYLLIYLSSAWWLIESVLCNIWWIGTWALQVRTFDGCLVCELPRSVPLFVRFCCKDSAFISSCPGPGILILLW